MKTKLISIIKHCLAFLIFAFFNSMMLIFAFSYTYLYGFIYAGENALIQMLVLVLPHIALLGLNFWLITFLRQRLELNKIFYKTMQAIATIIFALVFIILILDTYTAYAY